jgi:hypothetical protein
MYKRVYGFAACSLLLSLSVTAAQAGTLASGLLYGGTTQTGFACNVVNVSAAPQIVFNPQVRGTIQFNNCGGANLNTAVTLQPGGSCTFTGAVPGTAYAQCTITTGPLTDPATLRGTIDVRSNNGTVVLKTGDMR